MKNPCDGCPLEGHQRIEGAGLDAEKIVVGDYPTQIDLVNNRAFSDRPGRLAREFLDREDQDVGFTYAVQCYPGVVKSKEEKARLELARTHCRGHLDVQLSGAGPRQLLAMGSVASHSLGGPATAMGVHRGTEILNPLHGVRGILTYAPAYVLRKGGLASETGQRWRGDCERFLHPSELAAGARIAIDPERFELPPVGTPVVVDIETTGLDPAVCSPLYEGPFCPEDVTPGEPKIRCFGFAWRDAEGDLVSVVYSGLTRMWDNLELLGGWFPYIAQNYAFELKWFKAFGLNAAIYWDDTMLMAHALHEDRGSGNYKLEQLTADYAPEWNTTKATLLKGPWCLDEQGKHDKARAVLLCPLPQLMEYCAWDCLKELVLYERFREGLARDPLPTDRKDEAGVPGASTRYRRVAIPAAPFLDQVSERGLKVDADRLAYETERVRRHVGELTEGLKAVADINWNSDVQVRLALQALDLTHPGYTTKQGLSSVDSLARRGLIALNPEYAWPMALYDRYKKQSGILSKLKKLPEKIRADGCLHPRFHLAGPKTSRLSASGPSIQNFDTSLKRCIVPRGGYVFLEQDYEGIEIGWMVYLSGDERLGTIVREGRSLHTEVAADLGIERKVAKALNFKIPYGGGAQVVLDGFDEDDNIEWGSWDLLACKRLINDRKAMFPRLEEWKKEVEAEAKQYGQVSSVFGAVRRIPAAMDATLEGHWGALRQAVNHVVQSPASDMNLVRAQQCGGRVLTLTHDSILWEVEDPHHAAEQFRPILEDPEFYWGTLDPAPKVEFTVGTNWAEMESL